MTVALKAMVWARELHRLQKRRYTNEPYFVHLAEVAGMVASFEGPMRDISIAVAYGHDSMEDQGVTFDELVERFGLIVADGIRWLTDVEVGNRAARKAAACERLGKAPGWVQTIKCADLISNTQSIILHDPDFAKVYVKEKRQALDAMKGANSLLWHMANELIVGNS